MMKRTLVFLGSALFLLVSCAPSQLPTDEYGTESSAMSSEEEFAETENVLYRGTVHAAGTSIYMQGSHRLALEDGRFILLESNIVPLDEYLGEEVEVSGAVRPTVEEGGLIMRVESIRLLAELSSASSSSGALLESSSSEISSEAASAPSSVTQGISSKAVSSAISTVSVASTASQQAVSSTPWEASDELTAKAVAMAKDKTTPEYWSQQYCSTLIKFCIPIHKNWWYKSFGATSSTLWHVEVGPQKMENLGDGPLVINLLGGSVEGVGAANNQVSVQGNAVIGYRSWDQNRHFEVRAPATLEEAVRTITLGLRASE